MKTVTRRVYYCDHCARHRMTAKSIEAHEPKCIYNPDRSVCGWHPNEQPPPPAEHIPRLVDNLDLDDLRRWADGCPACMLAAVVQAGLTYAARDDLGFDYKTEVLRFRQDERDTEQYAEMRGIEAGWA